jgi:hypothetical protein
MARIALAGACSSSACQWCNMLALAGSTGRLDPQLALAAYSCESMLCCQRSAVDALLSSQVIGREREVARVIQILGRRTKNNPILLGEPGGSLASSSSNAAHWGGGMERWVPGGAAAPAMQHMLGVLRVGGPGSQWVS